ncbi:DUF3786 domain-containing protein [Ruminococcus sp. OA3]|uniref:DUF3786 domain-containing protein n=1 Tax=Ruminococcus sp. OA3 TaxID=2914164 RepID=UPI001F06A56A|nr:DUF3786 domain-containing protein [Ruminococcus sp. OA3]
MAEYQDNYEKVREDWKKKAVTWDYKERYHALGLTGYSEHGKLPVTYYGKKYEIDRETGSITDAVNPDQVPDFFTLMDIYHLFYYSKEKPVLSGHWVAFQDVPRASVFTKAFFEQTVNPFARVFSGRLHELLGAGEKLGFERIRYSDAGFQAMAFSCLPIRFLFWDGDEEFPAKANVLFDANITDFMHEETVVMVASDGLKRLTEAADPGKEAPMNRSYRGWVKN